MILDEPALEAWGERIGREAGRPLVLALRGELGAGKSVLARAVARGAGVHAAMPSPTFNLAFRYDTPAGALWHLDLYRLRNEDEVWELGWSEMGREGEVVLIEWPERAERLLPADRWDIRLEPGPSTRERVVRRERRGDAPDLPEPAGP